MVQQGEVGGIWCDIPKGPSQIVRFFVLLHDVSQNRTTAVLPPWITWVPVESMGTHGCHGYTTGTRGIHWLFDDPHYKQLVFELKQHVFSWLSMRSMGPMKCIKRNVSQYQNSHTIQKVKHSSVKILDLKVVSNIDWHPTDSQVKHNWAPNDHKV